MSADEAKVDLSRPIEAEVRDGASGWHWVPATWIRRNEDDRVPHLVRLVSGISTVARSIRAPASTREYDQWVAKRDAVLDDRARLQREVERLRPLVRALQDVAAVKDDPDCEGVAIEVAHGIAERALNAWQQAAANEARS